MLKKITIDNCRIEYNQKLFIGGNYFFLINGNYFEFINRFLYPITKQEIKAILINMLNSNKQSKKE